MLLRTDRNITSVFGPGCVLKPVNGTYSQLNAMSEYLRQRRYGAKPKVAVLGYLGL